MLIWADMYSPTPIALRNTWISQISNTRHTKFRYKVLPVKLWFGLYFCKFYSDIWRLNNYFVLFQASVLTSAISVRTGSVQRET